MKDYTTWKTSSELLFLRDLGTFYAPERMVPQLDHWQKRHRIKCLVGYIKAMPLRKRWDGIDKDAVAEFARKCLEIEEREFRSLQSVI